MLQPVEYDPETGSLWARDGTTGRALRLDRPDSVPPPPPPLDVEALLAALRPFLPTQEDLALALEGVAEGQAALRRELKTLSDQLDGLKALSKRLDMDELRAALVPALVTREELADALEAVAEGQARLQQQLHKTPL